MTDGPLLSPGGHEVDVDGLKVPAWMPGDDDYAERLQVSIVWHASILVNGREVLPWGVPIPEIDLYAATARLFRREVVRSRARALDDELAATAAGLGSTVDEFEKLTFAALETVVRRCLERRGFPVP